MTLTPATPLGPFIYWQAAKNFYQKEENRQILASGATSIALFAVLSAGAFLVPEKEETTPSFTNSTKVMGLCGLSSVVISTTMLFDWTVKLILKEKADIAAR